MQERILVIEDDPDISRLITLHLEDSGFVVDCVSDGKRGFGMLSENSYRLLLLDIMVPGMDGLEICKEVRKQDNPIPIMILTCRSNLVDKIIGLELGADDYLTKPFSVEELVSRVRALCRRAKISTTSKIETPSDLISIGKLELFPTKRKARMDRKELKLTAKQFDLLHFLAANSGRPFTREELLARVWDYNSTGYEHTVDSHINRLRAKIEEQPSNPQYIITVWGVGYKFAEPEEIA